MFEKLNLKSTAIILPRDRAVRTVVVLQDFFPLFCVGRALVGCLAGATNKILTEK